MVALEADVELFDEVLVPPLPTPENKSSDSRRDPSPQQQRKRPSLVEDKEVEKKSAPKRKCK